MIKCKVTKKNYARTRNHNGFFNKPGSNVDCRLYSRNRNIASSMANH